MYHHLDETWIRLCRDELLQDHNQAAGLPWAGNYSAFALPRNIPFEVELSHILRRNAILSNDRLEHDVLLAPLKPEPS